VAAKPTEMSDADLVARAQDGDRAAFVEIYDRHAAGVAGVLASFAGPDRDALDDLTQEVFFRVIDKIGSYRPSRPFAHWLYTIALNVGRNHARRLQKIVRLEPDHFETIAATNEVGSSWSEAVLSLTLAGMVARLSDPIKQVVSLRIGADLPFAEIAEVLGIPEGTARRRMHTAVQTLRSQIDPLIGRKEAK
jgi:RNA polymerase sigma-70 factor (ECF subfamily)